MDIYKITNTINSKIYIGKTEKTYLDRWENHKKKVRNGSNSCPYLYTAMRKYGIENFTCEKIDERDTIEELNLCEQFWIEKLNAQDRNIGYNIADGGSGGDIFHTLTKEQQNEKIEKTKKPIIEKDLQKKMTEKSNITRQSNIKEKLGEDVYRSYRAKKDERYNLEKLRKEFGFKACSKSDKMRWCNNGELQFMVAETEQLPKDFIWGRLSNGWTDATKDKVRKSNLGRKFYNNCKVQVFRSKCPEGFVEGMLTSSIDKQKNSLKTYYKTNKSKKCKKVICIETNEIFIGITYATDWLRNNKLSGGIKNIVKCCDGLCDTAGGYHWRYYE